jgi:DNA-binding SARP family transcriptional activator/Tfp pilus assembly protein PilF
VRCIYICESYDYRQCVIVRLLGPVEVTGPGGRAVLSTRQRALIGALALRAGMVVLADEVLDALWGEDQPRTALKSLQSHIARVRAALRACGLTDVLVTRGPGYLCTLAPDEVDVACFEDQLRFARAEFADGHWPAGVRALRAGLALWRGEPLSDGEPEGWLRAEVGRLQEARIGALEELWQAELRLGRPEEAAREVERLLVRHPLRERLVELLMLALYRVGRPLDALRAYQRLRTRLSEDLGVDPAPSLQRLHLAILRQDPDLGSATVVEPVVAAHPPAHRPAQLPPRVGHFTGRAAELEALDQLLVSDVDTRVAVIFGPGGIGKTALAVQWAHQIRNQFPDGQIFVELRGHDSEAAVSSTEALTHVVRSLGLPGDQIPAQLPALTAQFRSMLDGKRLLIVLDNAADVDQIRPLVPATTTSALVVTSRTSLPSLATYHAVLGLGLDVPSDEEALALLRAVAGRDRVNEEIDEALRIVAWCGRMPLALRIAAAKLAGEPRASLKILAEELAFGDRLDALSVDGDTRSVRTVFASAYRALSPDAARMFRLLGVFPGVSFDAHLAAALADLPLAVADRALAELLRAYLVAEADSGRFRLHDLIQLYAGECARRDEETLSRADAADRLIDWYLGVADVASRLLDRGRDPLELTLRHPLGEVPFRLDHPSTLAFLDAERENLLPVVRFAVEHGRHTGAWQVTYLLTGYFNSRGRWADRLEICRLGLAAAQRVGDPAAECLMRSGLGVALVMTRRFDEALDCLYPALELARRTGNHKREGHISNNIATAYARQRRFDEAVEAYLVALAVHQANDDALGITVACNNIGTAYIRLGQPDRSLSYLSRALDLIRSIDNPRIEAEVLFSLGEAALSQGRPTEALAQFQRALDIRRAIGDRRHEIDTLHSIGSARLELGDDGGAALDFQAALHIGQDLADQHLIAVSLAHLAQVHLCRDDYPAAQEYLRLALDVRTRSPDSYEEAVIYRTLAELATRQGQPAEAAEHRERAIALFHKANATAEAAQLA